MRSAKFRRGVIQYGTLRPLPPEILAPAYNRSGAESIHNVGVLDSISHVLMIYDCSGQCFGKVRYFSPRRPLSSLPKKSPLRFSKKN